MIKCIYDCNVAMCATLGGTCEAIKSQGRKKNKKGKCPDNKVMKGACATDDEMCCGKLPVKTT